MQFTRDQLDTCLEIIRMNQEDGTEYNNSAMCCGALIEEGLEKSDAIQLWSAAEIIDELELV